MTESKQQLVQMLDQLEAKAESLQSDAPTRAAYRQALMDYAEAYVEGIEQQPGYSKTESMGSGIAESPFVEEGTDLSAVLDLFDQEVVGPGSHPTSPMHFAYIPVSATYLSALGDFLAAITNRFSGNAFAGPGAVQMENQVVSWMQELVGFDSDAAGVLTSGGSVANLSAMVTAREACEIRPADSHRAVCYVSTHTHHSVQKALHIAGLGECVLRYVPVDDRGCVQTAALERLIDQDQAQGLRPWMVVASGGTTNLGSVDPLQKLGEIARARELWFHVDAAYGGFFLLTDRGREALAGIELADSVVLDPHKSLFVPFGTGAVLVRDGIKLFRAHAHTADYMQDADTGDAWRNPSDLSVELTRHFRALRMWLPLKVLGVAPYRAALDEKLLLAQYAHSKLSAMEGFELGPAPQLSIFVFRYLPAKADADEFNKRLVSQIHADGRLFLSSTVVDGRFMLRFPILSFRSHRAHIDKAIETIHQCVTRLLQES